MKVEITKDTRINKVAYKKGDIVNVSNGIAEKLTESGEGKVLPLKKEK